MKRIFLSRKAEHQDLRIKSSPKKAFTLIEIMIVIGVIMILAFLMVPNMLRANITANEAGAISNLRAYFTGLQIYYVQNARQYPEEISDLQGYVSDKLASGHKGGYDFIYTKDNEDQFHINANPRTPGKTGERYFYLDEGNVIKYNTGGQASATDPPASE